MRNCTNCQLVVACQQFRSRDCVHVDVLLCCKTLPIIEASAPIRFGCFRGAYFALAGQFAAAGMSVYNNNWSRIHDFSHAAATTHYALLSGDPAWLPAFFSSSLPGDPQALDVSLAPESALVGLRRLAPPWVSVVHRFGRRYPSRWARRPAPGPTPAGRRCLCCFLRRRRGC